MLDELFRRIAGVLNPSGGSPEPPSEGEADLASLRAEVDQAAQHTLDQIDDALSAWQALELRLEREQAGVTLWERKAAEAARTALSAPGAQPETWRRLREEAEAEAAARRERVQILSGIMEQARPSVDAALQLVEEVGFSREKALSQIERLEVTQATAAARERLASARLNGEAGRLEELLRAATEQVNALAARAAATEEVADTLGR